MGEVTAEFVAMLSEDHGEVLRQGDQGDEMVQTEDRLITMSLNGCTYARCYCTGVLMWPRIVV